MCASLACSPRKALPLLESGDGRRSTFPPSSRSSWAAFTQLRHCLCAAQVVPAVRMRYMLAMILSYVETVVYCTQLFCSCTHCCTPSLLCTSVRAKPQHYIFWLRPSPPFSSLLLPSPPPCHAAASSFSSWQST